MLLPPAIRSGIPALGGSLRIAMIDRASAVTIDGRLAPSPRSNARGHGSLHRVHGVVDGVHRTAGPLMHAKTWCYVGIDAARKWALCRRVQIAAASSGFTRERRSRSTSASLSGATTSRNLPACCVRAHVLPESDGQGGQAMFGAASMARAGRHELTAHGSRRELGHVCGGGRMRARCRVKVGCRDLCRQISHHQRGGGHAAACPARRRDSRWAAGRSRR